MKTETLTSPNNALLKAVRRALARGESTAGGFCVAEGFHLLAEAIRSGCEVGAVLLSGPGEAAWERRGWDLSGARASTISPAVFNELSTTEATQGVISLVRPPAWTAESLAPRDALVLVLDGIQEPGNAGAIVRTAEAFSATGVVFLKGTVNALNPKALRASAGSLFRVPFVQGVEEAALRAFVQDNKLSLFAMEPGGDLGIDEANLRDGCAIVIGNEGGGVRREIARGAAALTIRTTMVESLNAAVATGVVLYEARRQRVLP